MVKELKRLLLDQILIKGLERSKVRGETLSAAPVLGPPAFAEHFQAAIREVGMPIADPITAGAKWFFFRKLNHRLSMLRHGHWENAVLGQRWMTRTMQTGCDFD